MSSEAGHCGTDPESQAAIAKIQRQAQLQRPISFYDA